MPFYRNGESIGRSSTRWVRLAPASETPIFDLGVYPSQRPSKTQAPRAPAGPRWRANLSEREVLLAADPDKFYTTAYYAGHARVLARLDHLIRLWPDEARTELAAANDGVDRAHYVRSYGAATGGSPTEGHSLAPHSDRAINITE